jgi:hypothetical protein
MRPRVLLSSGENSVIGVRYFTDVFNIKVNYFSLVHETDFSSISMKVTKFVFSYTKF